MPDIDVYDVLTTSSVNVYDVLTTPRVYDVLTTDRYPLGKFGPVTRLPVAEVTRFDRWT